MSKRQVLILLGIWVMILFALGIPSNVKHVLAIISGAVIAFVAYRLKPDARSKKVAEALPYNEYRHDAMRDVTPPASPAPITNSGQNIS